MSWHKEAHEIEHRRDLSKQQGGQDAVEIHHAKGRLSIRERIDELVAADSFEEHGEGAGFAEKNKDGSIESFTPANYVIGLINNLKLSSLQRSNLKELSNIEFENLLIANKGIGPWSVQMARMFYLGDTDVMPINDLGIKHAHEYFFSEHEMSEKFYEPFRPWRTYLSLLMWKSLS